MTTDDWRSQGNRKVVRDLLYQRVAERLSRIVLRSSLIEARVEWL
jgi:hypothetical protein